MTIGQWKFLLMAPLPMTIGQRKFLPVAIEYFSKWIEKKPFAHIRASKVEFFPWENIICRYGILAELHSDNIAQFGTKEILNLCEDLGIRNYVSSPDYPQRNGQVARSNIIILDNLKKRLERAKRRWVEELLGVL